MRVSQVLFGATTRVALTSKHGNKNFYKGRGAKKMGGISRNGKFYLIKELYEQGTFIAPDLTGFELKAYVSKTTPRIDNEPIPPIFDLSEDFDKSDLPFTEEDRNTYVPGPGTSRPGRKPGAKKWSIKNVDRPGDGRSKKTSMDPSTRKVHWEFVSRKEKYRRAHAAAVAATAETATAESTA